MAKIKVNTVGVSALRKMTNAIKRKTSDCASTVSYVRRNLDVEISASQDIIAELIRLQKRLQAQESKMTRYAAYLNRVNDDFVAADRRISKQARNLHYLMNLATFLQNGNKTRRSIEGVDRFQDASRMATLFGITAPPSMEAIAAIAASIIVNPRGTREFPNTLPMPDTEVPAGLNNKKKPKKSFWERIGDWCEDTVDKAKKLTNKVAGAIKDEMSDTYACGKAVVNAFKDELSDTAESVKIVTASNTTKYAWETGKGVLNFAGKALSFGGNVLAGKWPSAAVDIYDACNGIIDIGQDASAFTLELIAGGCSIFGAEKASSLLSEAAADYSSRDGLAGEFRSAGSEGIASVIDAADIVSDAYGFYAGFGKIDKAFKSGNWKDVASLSGWTLDSTGKAMISNAKLAAKYVDGAIEASSFRDFINTTVFGNTTPCKQLNSAVKLPADIGKFILGD